MVWCIADIDECQYSVCDHNCINSEGSYTCTCNSGFYLDRDGRSCLGKQHNAYTFEPTYVMFRHK